MSQEITQDIQNGPEPGVILDAMRPVRESTAQLQKLLEQPVPPEEEPAPVKRKPDPLFKLVMRETYRFIRDTCRRDRNSLSVNTVIEHAKAVMQTQCGITFSDKDETRWLKRIEKVLSWLQTKPNEGSLRRIDKMVVDEDIRAQKDLLKFADNDEGNAFRLIHIHGDDIRYCEGFKKWLVWDETRWRIDDVGEVTELAFDTMNRFKDQVNAWAEKEIPNAEAAKDDDRVKAAKARQRFANSSLNMDKVNAMLKAAYSKLPVRPDDLDTYPLILNFQNGELDLSTGELRPHERFHYLTKVVNFEYNEHATCPTFLKFLNYIMGAPEQGDNQARVDVLDSVKSDKAERMVNYLQTAIGYSLTASTKSKAVFVLYGKPDAGKTTLLTLMRNLIPEYSQLLSVETLMLRRKGDAMNNNAQAELADLRGMRFVTTSETEEGQRLSQAKLKSISQGDSRVKACRKYENPIDFAETHKLWLDTNKLPTIPDTADDATFNRLHCIEFTVTVPKEKQDRNLQEKLMAEAEGILAWAVRGAMHWHQEGLIKPKEVEQANDEWRKHDDPINRFLGECCLSWEQARAQNPELGREACSVEARALYRVFTEWTKEVGEYPLSEKLFGERMKQQKGVTAHHSRTGWQYRDIVFTEERDPDTLRAFLKEGYVIHSDAKVPAASMYPAYTNWTEGSNVKPWLRLTRPRFDDAIHKRGITMNEINGTVYYLGIGARTNETEPAKQARQGTLGDDSAF